MCKLNMIELPAAKTTISTNDLILNKVYIVLHFKRVNTRWGLKIVAVLADDEGDYFLPASYSVKFADIESEAVRGMSCRMTLTGSRCDTFRSPILIFTA